jgi:hypothetical protein
MCWGRYALVVCMAACAGLSTDSVGIVSSWRCGVMQAQASLVLSAPCCDWACANSTVAPQHFTAAGTDVFAGRVRQCQPFVKQTSYQQGYLTYLLGPDQALQQTTNQHSMLFAACSFLQDATMSSKSPPVYVIFAACRSGSCPVGANPPSTPCSSQLL